MSPAFVDPKNIRFALVAPESVLEQWRREVASEGLSDVTRFATRCDILLGESGLEWVCVH